MDEYGGKMGAGSMAGAKMPKGKLNSHGGKDPLVPRLEKHPIKSGFFTKKPGMKGEC